NPASWVTGAITLTRRSRRAARPPREPAGGRSGRPPRGRDEKARPSLRPRGVTGATPSSWRVHSPYRPRAGTGGCAERSARLATALRRHAGRSSPPLSRAPLLTLKPSPGAPAHAQPPTGRPCSTRHLTNGPASGAGDGGGGVHYGGAVRAG